MMQAPQKLNPFRHEQVHALPVHETESQAANSLWERMRAGQIPDRNPAMAAAHGHFQSATDLSAALAATLNKRRTWLRHGWAVVANPFPYSPSYSKSVSICTGAIASPRETLAGSARHRHPCLTSAR